MKNRVNLIFLIVFSFLLAVGCTVKDNPVDPEDPGIGNTEPEIKKPVYLKLNSIELSRFAPLKSNGDKWDYHVFTNSPTRRPDIYVEINKSGSSTVLFKSDTKEDAELENAYDYYSFSKSGEKNGRNLPISLDFDQFYEIKIYDDDGLSSNDKMSEFSIRGENYYKNDNADFVYHTITSGSYTIEIKGNWIY